MTYSLKGRHPAGEITQPLTRAQAMEVFTKWAAAARRHARKGQRILFIMHAHGGRCYDRLVIETTHATLRAHKEAQGRADAHKRWVTR